MPGVEGAECEDHDECKAGELELGAGLSTSMHIDNAMFPRERNVSAKRATTPPIDYGDHARSSRKIPRVPAAHPGGCTRPVCVVYGTGES